MMFGIDSAWKTHAENHGRGKGMTVYTKDDGAVWQLNPAYAECAFSQEDHPQCFTENTFAFYASA